MKIIRHLASGACRAAKSWKWILVIWFSTLIVVSLVVLPLRAGINNILGSSMITELLKEGIHADVIANTGTKMSVIVSFLTSGMFLVLLSGFLLNVFFSGGLFSALKTQEAGGSFRDFFRESASNFWSFLVIILLMSLMALLILLIVMGIPTIASRGSDSEKAVFNTLKISGSAAALIMPVVLLVTDYARAWQAASGKKNAFTAIGNGFKQTFRKFFSSYALMVLLLVIQALFTWLMYFVASAMKPAGGGGIFLMFILLQAMFIMKIYLRVSRYGIVTSLFEKLN